MLRDCCVCLLGCLTWQIYLCNLCQLHSSTNQEFDQIWSQPRAPLNNHFSQQINNHKSYEVDKCVFFESRIMSLSGSFQPHPKCKYIHVLHIFTQRLPLLIIDKEERRDSFKLERMSFTGIYLSYEKRKKGKSLHLPSTIYLKKYIWNLNILYVLWMMNICAAYFSIFNSHETIWVTTVRVSWERRLETQHSSVKTQIDCNHHCIVELKLLTSHHWLSILMSVSRLLSFMD